MKVICDVYKSPGTLSQGLSFETLLENVKSGFHTGCIKYSQNNLKEINSVAVLGGSGSFAIDKAKALGAQVYITSDLKYHDYFRKNNRAIIGTFIQFIHKNGTFIF